MKIPELKPWRSSLTPGTAWPFTSNIPPEVSGVEKDISDLKRKFASDRDFEISYVNDFHAYPSVDIQELTDGYRLDADLAGINEQEIELELHGKTLSIKGHKVRDSANHGQYIHRERCFGGFCREITFEQEVNINNIFASMQSGVLHIRLEKVHAPLPQ